MNYYEKLVRQVDKSMKAHPRSTVVMDSDSFEVLASGTDPKKVSRKLRLREKRKAISVVFQSPGKNSVWILRSHLSL